MTGVTVLEPCLVGDQRNVTARSMAHYFPAEKTRVIRPRSICHTSVSIEICVVLDADHDIGFFVARESASSSTNSTLYQQIDKQKLECCT